MFKFHNILSMKQNGWVHGNEHFLCLRFVIVSFRPSIFFHETRKNLVEINLFSENLDQRICQSVPTALKSGRDFFFLKRS